MFSSEFIFFLNWLTAVPVSVCMRRSSAGELVPLDLEIEATFKRNNVERKRKLLHDRTVASILEEAHFSESSSSNSPTSRESQIAEFEAEVMAKEQPRRVTLVFLPLGILLVCVGAKSTGKCTGSSSK